jgi:4-hydroxy-4-methyl-2-oxoglutarate aldolase
VSVTVAGMDVCPGEIVHMDENGGVKFPADRLEAVLANVRALQVEEEARMSALQSAGTVAEIRAILSVHSYSNKEDQDV